MADAQELVLQSIPVAGPSRSKSPPVEPVLVKEEPVDPLQMDIDEDDIDFDAEKLDGEVSENSLNRHPF